MRFFDFYVGVDPAGTGKHFTAVAVLCRTLDHDDGAPVLEVQYLARARGVPNRAIAGEVGRVLANLPDDAEARVGVDATGLGHGTAQELRRQRVRVTEVVFGSGSGRVVRRESRWSVPVPAMHDALYSALQDGRLRVNPGLPLYGALVQEFGAVECEFDDVGRARFTTNVPVGHGDLLSAVGVAALLHEVPWSRRVERAERRSRVRNLARPVERERPYGRIHRSGSAGREVIDRHLEESRLRAERETWAPVWDLKFGRDDSTI